jgi:hypothetical protein
MSLESQIDIRIIVQSFAITQFVQKVISQLSDTEKQIRDPEVEWGNLCALKQADFDHNPVTC